MVQVPPKWRPMMREAGIAASTLYSGLNSLRKANYAEHELYDQAFFGISIGLERMMKLGILLHARATGSDYPSAGDFRRRYSHDLARLFEKIEEIRSQYSHRLQWDLPNRPVSIKALAVLADFAKITRYYNLDVLVGSAQVANLRDPVEAWHSDVVSWILQKKYPQWKRKEDEEFAEIAHMLLDGRSSVIHTAEDGAPISTIHDATLRSRQINIVQRESVVICACLARHISELLWELERDAMAAGADDVPFLHEFYSPLYNSESMFRSRKTFKL